MAATDTSAGGFGPPAQRRDEDRVFRWAAFAPGLLLMLAMGLLPLLNLFATSFMEVNWAGGQATRTFVGTQHYPELLHDPLVGAAAINTTVFAVVAVAGQLALGFFLAVLVSGIRRGRVFFRALFILPILIPGIVIGAIWKLMLNFDFGLVNQLIGIVGLGPFDWLGDSATALLSVILVDIWHWMPFCFLLCLAGIESLPAEVFEAARMDGASRWSEFWYVTVPLMLPTIVVTFAFRLVLAFKVFDEVYLLTGGGPGTSTEVISFTLYQRFFTEDRVGYGAAMSVMVIFTVSLLLVLSLSARRFGRAP